MRSRQGSRSRKPGTTCAPSMIRCVPSIAARSTSACTPTATAAVCSRNPTTTSSFDGGSRRTEPASNDDACSVGMSSWENSARITSRIASVATTRTIPSRVASWVASVDLPTPVAPPISTTSGTCSASISRQRWKFRAYRSPARSSSTREGELAELLVRDRRHAALAQALLDRLGDLVRANGRQPGHHDLGRHQALRIRQARVAIRDQDLRVLGVVRHLWSFLRSFRWSLSRRPGALRSPARLDRLPQRGRKVRVALQRDGAVVHEDHLGAPSHRSVARDVDRRGFELRQEHLVGLRTVQVLRQTGPIGEPGTPPDHSASVGPLEGFRLSCGHRPRRRGGEEHVPAPHIAEWLWFEVRHDEPGISVQPFGVGPEGRDVLQPGWATRHGNNDKIR